MGVVAFPQMEIGFAGDQTDVIAERAHENQLQVNLAERDRLVLEQLPLVRHIARHFHTRVPPSVLFDDLFQSGILGLMDAVDKFDTDRRVDIRAYATHRIRGAILDSLRELDCAPRSLRKKGRDLDDLRERLTSALHRQPTEAEIAEEAGCELEELRQLEEDLLRANAARTREQSIDEEIRESADDQPSSDDASPYSLCYKKEIQELLWSCMDQLSERERQMLVLYYYKGLTMEDIGAVLGVSEARVSEIHSAALRKARSHLQARQGAKTAGLLM